MIRSLLWLATLRILISANNNTFNFLYICYPASLV